MSKFSSNFCNKSPFKKEPEYRNLVEGEDHKFTLSDPVDKKDWDKKSGQVQRYKKGTSIPKSTVTRTKYGTEREHEWGRIRYDKSADQKIGKFSRI
jgi:hypothetical protein